MGEYTKTVAELEALSFDFGMESYPIFDETYRDTLNSKILGHYKYHEICNEDTAIFKHYLNQELEEIMPLYNQLYVSAALSFNPLLTFSKTENITVATTQATEGENTIAQTVENTGTQTQENTGSVVQDNTGTETLAKSGTMNQTSSNANGQTITNAETRSNSVSDTGTTEAANNNAQKVVGKDISSDTPQGLLAADDINGNVWATNARITDTGTTATGTTFQEVNSDREENGTANSTNTVAGTASGSLDSENEETNTNTLDTNTTVATTGNTSVATTANATTATTGNTLIETTGSATTGTTSSGYDRPLAELVKLHRETFLNIDVKIIRELKDCFFLIY